MIGPLVSHGFLAGLAAAGGVAAADGGGAAGGASGAGVGAGAGLSPHANIEHKINDQVIERIVEACLTAQLPPTSLAGAIAGLSHNPGSVYLKYCYESDMPKNITSHPVHLGLGAKVVSEPEFSGMEWYAAYGARHASDGDEGRLVALFTFDAPWDSWEMHPRGDELVLCTAGSMTLVQELDGKHVRTTLKPGEYAINARGVWHTADVDLEGSATALFITSGAGTEHRKR